MNKRRSLSVTECKIQASKLLKSLKSHDPTALASAQARLAKLDIFRDISPHAIDPSLVKRKHVLLLIAQENGFECWVDLKCQIPFIRGGYLNHWFSSYQEAKAYQEKHGGYLLPYKKQCFLCEKNYIANLGFNSDDPDWAAIGFDWVKPNDEDAWRRLYQKWMVIQEKVNGKR